jgi:sugar phosphate isomerase/epimerase
VHDVNPAHHRGAPGLGVCLDLFHYYTGPSKFEDLAYLSCDNLAWVQVCDLSGTPREIASDGDRILPGEGDFQIGPILDHLGRIVRRPFVTQRFKAIRWIFGGAAAAQGK